MKKRFWDFGKYYLILLFVLIFSCVTIASVCGDVNESAAEVAVKNLEDDARLFTSYFDDMISNNFSLLKQLGKRLEELAANSPQGTQEIIDDYKEIFHSVEVVNSEGNREYGDVIEVDLTQDGLLDSLVFDRKDVVYGGSITEKDGIDSIVLCVPLERMGGVVGILLGTVPVSQINDLMDRWGYAEEDCVFVMNHKGNYLSGGKKFDKVLGGKANSYFTYLTNSNLSGEIESIAEFERELLKQEAFSARYSYIGKSYVGRFCPSKYGDWHLGFVERADNFYRERFSFSLKTIVLLVIVVAFWAVVLAFAMHAIYKNVNFRTELERYSIIYNLEQSIILEMSFSPKRLEFFGDTKAMFGVENGVVLNGEEVFDVYKYVHEDDQSVRGRLHRFYDEEEGSVFAAEIRIKNGADSYGWYRISGTVIKDKRFGTNLKFVAKIENADQQIAEEKDLVQRAENDLLTGILNKKTMEEKVAHALSTVTGNNHCIFFMVDLDNFKNVNDKLGHIYGDKAIVDTAHFLTELFPNNAYVGRLGGDEFAVCAVYDAFDKESMFEYIKKKAEKICEVNRRTYSNGTISVDISSSVGISVALDSEKDFETVYKMADNALYRSKNGGKNCYHIYQK
ncbi:diguanylate cyclase [bacterium D16-51]|nr:diguanylate cyclase [bacterium D16-59]RKI59386.1 diguanylate cyclase [bacterium D16-51]